MIRHLLWVTAVVGCASPMSALRDDNRRLTTSVTELRADRRAQDRKLRDLQHQLDLIRANQVTATPMPSLPVEVVAPAEPASNDQSRVVGITDDGTEIVYEGDAAAGKVATLDDSFRDRASSPIRSADRLEVTRRIPPVSARVTRAPARDRDTGGDAPNDYRSAVELVRAGKHTDAVAALRAFLTKFPRHEYADNAQYWLGEAFYAQRDYSHALAEFRVVIETYPRGNKVPDALLKVGFCYGALGQHDKARAVLEQVVTLYPNTEPAALAAKRLESS
ncbi:MAG: tol-pal system protein YbgF [Kofleriaceae bacterium]